MRKVIALNGWPGSGKSAVADLIVKNYGGVIVDDGLILREAAPILFQGIAPEDCFTQQGKSKHVSINGQSYTVRQALGYLGQCLEDFFGEDYIPDQTMRRIAALPDAPYYVLPSVRKGQGWFYRRHGAMVFEVSRPGHNDSGNAFDRWDQRAVQLTLNNGGSLEDLDVIVQAAMHRAFLDAGYARLTRSTNLKLPPLAA